MIVTAFARAFSALVWSGDGPEEDPGESTVYIIGWPEGEGEWYGPGRTQRARVAGAWVEADRWDDPPRFGLAIAMLTTSVL